MTKYISQQRLQNALTNIGLWRTGVPSQASAHLFPFLALINGGVKKGQPTVYGERNDKTFCDEHFRVEGNEELPYFDPIKLERRIPTWPHSSVSTLRKNTFARRWNAGEFTLIDGVDNWRLMDNFSDILRSKMLTLQGQVTRPNVLDVAAWLLKYEAFEDSDDARSIEQKFLENYPIEDSDYQQLFEFRDEDVSNLFSDTPLTPMIVSEVVDSFTAATPEILSSRPKTDRSVLTDEDPILSEVHHLLAIQTSGIIFRGCPGTGKTWYAWNIALSLTNNKPDHITRVQFHSSFGYEDFVEGYRPAEDSKSGFKIENRKFLVAVDAANKQPDETFVFIVDEINRGDPSRIFGEVLTYIEHDWRGMSFSTPFSGQTVSIPKNLILLATMNPHDRSVTPLDMALFRRFDHVDITPSAEQVENFLLDAGMLAPQASLVTAWFDSLQNLLPDGIGHTYFVNVRDMQQLTTVWRYRILPFCQAVLEFDK